MTISRNLLRTIPGSVAIVSFLGALLCTQSGPAIARQIRNRPDFVTELANRDQVFVGTIDAVRIVDYVPSGPCAEGVTPSPVTEVTITAKEILHGAGIHEVETMVIDTRFPDPLLVPGATIVAYGNRTCADNWNIWGNVVPFDEKGSLVGRRGQEQALDSWNKSHGRKAAVKDIKALIGAQAQNSSTFPIHNLAGLHLVVVEGRELSGRSMHISCRPIKQLMGRESAGPRSLVFDFPEDAYCFPIHVGDSLVVPFRGGDHSPERHIVSCANFLQVNHGFLPGLGVSLDQLARRFDQSNSGFTLRSSLDAREEQ